MDSNFRKCIFLASFRLECAHVLVALLVIEVSPMVLYPSLRLGWFEPLARPERISPRDLELNSANNSGTTQVKIPYRIAACKRSKIRCMHKTRIPRSVLTLETTLFLPMSTVHL